MKKTFISIAVALVLLLGLLPGVAFAATEGVTSGSFGAANEPPTITSLHIIPAGGGLPVTGMTPGVSYKAEIVVGDVNTLDDIDQIRVCIVFDGTDTDPTADPGVTGNTQNLVCLKWLKIGDAWSISPTAGGTTWSITTLSCTRTANMALSTGTWEFYFTVGKVATEGPGGVGVAGWDLFGAVNDAGTPVTAWGDRDLAMDWYGAIAVNTGTVPFGAVDPGTGFAEDTNELGNISVTYIANGNYGQKVKSANIWEGVTNDATFDDGGTCSTAKQFSLKADVDATLDGATQVTIAGATISSTGTQTVELGSTVTTNTLWLKLASVFPVDTYRGTITYIIADR